MSKKNPESSAKLKFICALIAFFFTWFVDPNSIFNKFFSDEYNRTFSAFQSLMDKEKLERNENGFGNVMKVLHAKTDTGTVLQIQIGGSMFLEQRENQSIHTYWFMGINELGEKDKKLGEITYNDADMENKIVQTYKAPIIGILNGFKTAILFFVGAYGVYELVPIRKSRNK